MVVPSNTATDDPFAVVTTLIWTHCIPLISWTILNRLFIILNNEWYRSPRSRRLCHRGAHPEFSPRRAGEPRLGFQPQPAAAGHGGAARGPPDEPHHAQRGVDRGRRIVAGPHWAGDARRCRRT